MSRCRILQNTVLFDIYVPLHWCGSAGTDQIILNSRTLNPNLGKQNAKVVAYPSNPPAALVYAG